MADGAAEGAQTIQQLSQIRDAVNRVSLDLQHGPANSDPTAIKALLDLRTACSSILSWNPPLASLSQQLADSVQELHDSKPSGPCIVSFVARRLRSHEVSRLAAEIEAELRQLIDREIVCSLMKSVTELRRPTASLDEDKMFDEMSALLERLGRGFDIDLQDLLLKSTVFGELKWVLCNPLSSRRVREKAAILVKELVLFNKDVFVGSFLGGGAVEALVLMGTLDSLRALSALIKAIRSPLVDEIESSGGILKIVGYLSLDDVDMKIMALDCAMKIGYFGRKEAVEAMIDCGIVKRLVELQRLQLGGAGEELDGKRCNWWFSRCVTRFAVQVEVGEGLRQREKRAFKQEILSRVREDCTSDAEAATILAEVLWGSSP